MLRVSLVLVPVQMPVSLAVALILDIVITRFARFSRLMIFMPYAIPGVIGALMWGFLYSPRFGRLAAIFGASVDDARVLSTEPIFAGLLNVVTWQWAGYYMIVIYAALRGIDPTLYEAARIDGASQRQIILRIKVPMVTPALLLILVFALIGTLQFFTEPKILQQWPPAPSRTTSRRTCTPISRRSRWRSSTTARRSRSRSARSSSSRLHLPLPHSQARERHSHDRHTCRGHRHPSDTGRPFARRRSPRTRGRIPLNIVLALLMIYFLIPFWWLIVNSSKSAAGLFGGDSSLWFADDIDYIGNLVDLFTYSGGIYARWLANSVLYAIVGGVGATVLAVLAGYGFAKYRFAGRRASFAILLGAVMVPMTALVIPTFVLFAQAGLTNTIWAVILPTLLNPFGVYLMNVYSQDAVPDELLDAARVDGAGEFRTFFQVALPLLRPAIVTVLLLSVVASWNNYFLPLGCCRTTSSTR